MSGRNLVINGLTLVLCLATWLFFEKIDHYRNVSAELLTNHSFTSSLSGWYSSKNVSRNQRDTIDLSNWQFADGHYINQTLHRPKSGIVRLSADARLNNVVKGPKVWHKARIDILGREAGGSWQWDFPNTLFANTGTLELDNISQVFHIPAPYSDIRIECELTGGTGGFQVSRVSLVEVEVRHFTEGVTYSLIACWICLSLIATALLVRQRLIPIAAGLATVCMLLLALPEDLKQFLVELLNNDLGVALDHLLLFFFATILVLIGTIDKGTISLKLVSLMSFSLATEILQYFTSHRDPLLVDAATNMVGILAGAISFHLFSTSRLLNPKR